MGHSVMRLLVVVAAVSAAGLVGDTPGATALA